MQAERNGQPTLKWQEAMHDLPLEKQALLCLFKINEATGRELTVRDYFPGFANWLATSKEEQARIVAKLMHEALAMEQLGPRAKHCVTMRDKLLEYIAATNRIGWYTAEQLERPMTWGDFRAVVNREVAQGGAR